MRLSAPRRPALLGALPLLQSFTSGPGFPISHAVCRIVLGALFVLSAGFFVRRCSTLPSGLIVTLSLPIIGCPGA